MSNPYDDLPQAPGADVALPAARPTGPPPGSVHTAFYLMLVRVALSVISVIVLFATKDDFKRTYLDNNPNASSSTIDSAITVGAAIGIVILLFYLFLAFKVRAGANWARIVTWVFAGLGVLGLLFSFAQTSTGLNKTFTIVQGLIDIVIIVLLALGESNRYFRRP